MTNQDTSKTEPGAGEEPAAGTWVSLARAIDLFIDRRLVDRHAAALAAFRDVAGRSTSLDWIPTSVDLRHAHLMGLPSPEWRAALNALRTTAVECHNNLISLLRSGELEGRAKLKSIRSVEWDEFPADAWQLLDFQSIFGDELRSSLPDDNGKQWWKIELRRPPSKPAHIAVPLSTPTTAPKQGGPAVLRPIGLAPTPAETFRHMDALSKVAKELCIPGLAELHRRLAPDGSFPWISDITGAPRPAAGAGRLVAPPIASNQEPSPPTARQGRGRQFKAFRQVTIDRVMAELRANGEPPKSYSGVQHTFELTHFDRLINEGQDAKLPTVKKWVGFAFKKYNDEWRSKKR